MALYAIGDFHLSFQTDKSMDKFGKVWKNHEEKIKKNCGQLCPEDTLVITGDHSWGRNLDECTEDLAFIEDLPGRKILLRGNHDMFWDAKKTAKLNREFEGRLSFLQNNYYAYGEDYALVGTKGYTFEGPFYLDSRGRITGWDEDAEAHAQKLIEREVARLQKSFDAAVADGYQKFVMFLHYPPTCVIEQDSPFIRLAEQYHVEHVVYSHCHGESRFNDSIRGEYHGITYHLVSGDFLNFCPERIL